MRYFCGNNSIIKCPSTKKKKMGPHKNANPICAAGNSAGSNRGTVEKIFESPKRF